MTPLIETSQLEKYYNLGTKVEVSALNDINLQIFSKEFVVFFGPSGSGKTTLLSIIGTLDRQTDGKIMFKGEDITKFSEVELSRMRRKTFGFVFQNYNLISGVSAWRNVAYPLIPTGIGDQMLYEKAREVMSKVGLERRLSHTPEEMSGGEQQRVALARALVNDPEIIIADEPTSNIDAGLVQGVMDLFASLNKEGRTILVTSHNPLFLEEAETIFYLKEGKVEATERRIKNQ